MNEMQSNAEYHPDTPSGYISHGLHHIFGDHGDKHGDEFRKLLKHLDELVAHLSRCDEVAAYESIKQLEIK